MVNYDFTTIAAVSVVDHAAVIPHLWAPLDSIGPHPSMQLLNYTPANIPSAGSSAPPVASHLSTKLSHGAPSALY
jgi:hypothetical protein